MFGSKDQVDPVRHLIGTATGWGGNPEKDAFYLTVTPSKNDGTTIHRLTVKDVPVNGFWSISVYNTNGYFEPNNRDAYTLNNITAKKSADGSIEVQFGGCDSTTANCIPVTPGWNYWVCLYRPRAEILTGKWIFPEGSPPRRPFQDQGHRFSVLAANTDSGRFLSPILFLCPFPFFFSLVALRFWDGDYGAEQALLRAFG